MDTTIQTLMTNSIESAFPASKIIGLMAVSGIIGGVVAVLIVSLISE